MSSNQKNEWVTGYRYNQDCALLFFRYHVFTTLPPAIIIVTCCLHCHPFGLPDPKSICPKHTMSSAVPWGKRSKKLPQLDRCIWALLKWNHYRVSKENKYIMIFFLARKNGAGRKNKTHQNTLLEFTDADRRSKVKQSSMCMLCVYVPMFLCPSLSCAALVRLVKE